jgi:glutamate/tyrosine decarboxylase-like PLP-dependent enzyme
MNNFYDLFETAESAKQADSIAFEFHKWLYSAYDAECIVIGRIKYFISKFSNQQSYLPKPEKC